MSSGSLPLRVWRLRIDEMTKSSIQRSSEASEVSYLSTGQVARALGIGVSTVKRWVDEEILPAYRTAGGHRRLLMADVLRLVRDGGVPGLDPGRLWGSPGRSGPAETAAHLAEALRDGEGPRIRALIHGTYEAGLRVAELADLIISPAMQQIGHDWQGGRLAVKGEHRGTQLCTAALYELRPRLESRAARNRPVAIGGAPEGDHYTLGSLLAEMVLLDAGWKAINLGPNTPVASFREAIADWRPRLLWLSVSFLADAGGFLAEYERLRRDAERAGVAVAVGGRALTGSIRSAMTFSTYGDGLRHLAAFARSLHPPPRPPGRGRPPRRGAR